MPLHIQVVTPEKITLDTEADEIVVPTVTGEIAVLPSHAPLFTQLAPGEMIIKKGSNSDHFVIVGGFLEISKDKVTVLADYAVHGKDISEVQAQQAMERAKKKMEENLSAEDFAIAESELRRALMELKVVKKYKR